MAIDQMPGGKLAANAVVSRLSTNDSKLKETLLWIAGRHAEWGDKLAGYFRGELDGISSKPLAAQDELQSLLARLSGSPAIQSLVGKMLSPRKTSATTTNLLLGVVEKRGLQQLPEEWVRALVELLERGTPESLPRVIETVRRAASSRGRIEPLAAALVKLAGNKSLPDATRLAALAAIPGASNQISPELFDYARRFLGRESPAAERTAALDAISRAKLSRHQLLSLSAALGQLGPLEVDRLLEAFQQSRDEEVGLALAGELGRYEMLTSLRIDMIKPRLAKYPTTVQNAAEPLYSRIDAGLAQQAEKLERILHELPAGDARRGQAVFHSAKVSCTSCHAIGYLGGRVGPDLTLIAKIRTKRDLVESIVFPSASIVRSYEPVMIETRSGMVYNGLIKQETADQVELVTGPDRTVRIAKSDIEETRPSKTSVMPAGMDQILTRQELADLVEFLETCK
jgi:putative heme-binding domain-containing protein